MCIFLSCWLGIFVSRFGECFVMGFVKVKCLLSFLMKNLCLLIGCSVVLLVWGMRVLSVCVW